MKIKELDKVFQIFVRFSGKIRFLQDISTGSDEKIRNLESDWEYLSELGELFEALSNIVCLNFRGLSSHNQREISRSMQLVANCMEAMLLARGAMEGHPARTRKYAHKMWKQLKTLRDIVNGMQ